MAPLTIEEIEARQAEIQARVETIDAEHAGAALPESMRGEWNDLNAERDANDTLLAELRARRARIEQFAQNPDNLEAPRFSTARPGAVRGNDIYDLSTIRANWDDPESATGELRDRALRVIERADFGARAQDTGDPQGIVERRMRQFDTKDGQLARHLLVTGSPTYDRAFRKYLASQGRTPEEERALSLTGASGGFAVPFTLDPTIIPTSNSSVNPWRALARVEAIVGSNTWQGVSSAGVTATRVAELTEATDGAPTLAQPTATVTKAQTFIPFDIEIDQDWPALRSEMASLIQDAKDDEEAAAFATGAGTTVNPQGVVTGTTNTVPAATGLTVTAANLYALEAALPPRFRPNEAFVANRGIYNVIRAIDTAGGAALWLYVSQGLVTQAPRPGNTGATLLGAGAWESSAMQATVVNATKIMIVGDFRYFLIVDRIGLTVEVVPHIFGATSRFPIGQRGLYAYWRNTSKVLDANAFRALTGTT